MSTEPSAAATGDASALPPQAAVAMLTLRLRGAIQEADRAEAAERAADHDAARREMRTRLDAMISERSRVHEAALQAAVDAATSDVDAARRAAATIAAERRAEAERAAVAAATAAAAAEAVTAPITISAGAGPVPAPAASAAPDTGSAEPFAAPPPNPPSADRMADGADDTAPHAHSTAGNGAPQGAADTDTAAAGSAAAGSASTGSAGATGPTHGASAPQVMVDAEVLARVFATVFSSMVDERLAAWSRAAAGPQALPPAPPRRRSSVLGYLKHPDVLLLAVATVICLVVLASWMG